MKKRHLYCTNTAIKCPCLPLADDDHWVIDTDYDNYAVHYSCRHVDDNGTCLDSYSFIFSRHLTGLRAEDQSIVQQKKAGLCLQGKYRRINHTGESNAKFISLMQGSIDRGVS